MQPLKKPFRLPHLLACLAVALICYSSMGFLPAFNADDIIQGQAASGDYNTFLAAGRWGFYVVYRVLFDVNPAGPFAMLVGVTLLSIAAYVGARVLKLQSVAAVSAFILVSTVSIYFASSLAFDSTRIAYPLSTVAAIGGLYLMLSGRWLVGVLLFSLAPSLFPASAQVSATVLLAALLRSLLFDGDVRSAARLLLLGVIGMAIGVAIYHALTVLSPSVTGIPLSGRSSVDVLKALRTYERFVRILGGHALPSGLDLAYFNATMKAAIWVLIAFLPALVIASARSHKRAMPILFAIGCSIALFLAPFSLALASPADEFGPRALIAYSFVHAALAGIAIEYLLRAGGDRWLLLPVTAAGTLVLGTGIAISQLAFDEYLVSRNDFLATNRIVYRIEEVAARDGIPLDGPIPLIVKYDRPFSTAPSGVPSTSRNAPWSREWIFRHIDPRMAPVPEPRRGQVLAEAGDRPAWPREGSVFVQDGVVVVNIN